jgi:hypothetical protein
MDKAKFQLGAHVQRSWLAPCIAQKLAAIAWRRNPSAAINSDFHLPPRRVMHRCAFAALDPGPATWHLAPCLSSQAFDP